MVTDVYFHILDDDRRKNAELFEEAFYEKKNLDPQMHVQQENNNATVADEVDPELLAKVLANPEMRALLLESPSFDDGMMEIQLQKRLQIFLLNKICQSKTHGQTVSYALYYL